MSQFSTVTSRLLTLLPTLPGWSTVAVFDGEPIAAVDGLDYCLVGYSEPDGEGRFRRGAFTADLSRVGNAFEEEVGAVACELSCNTGDDDLLAVRTRLEALCDAVRTSLRADRTLGVLPRGSVATFSADLYGTKNVHGSGVSALFTISYVTTPY